MLEIYWVKDPSPLSEELYPEFTLTGELTREDIRNVMDRINKKTYSDHFANLAIILRVVEEVEESNIMALVQGVHEVVRSEDPGVLLFDLLVRLPHFARWVQLTQQRSHTDIDPHEIVPVAERGSEMRLDRPQQFQRWAETINELSTNTSFDELRQGFELSRAIIWDSYLDYNDSMISLEPAVLMTILGAAMNVGGAVEITSFADILEINEEQVYKLIDEYLIPVGVPVSCTSGVASLTTSTEFYVPRTVRIFNQIESLMPDSDTSFESVDDVGDYLQYDTGLLTFTGPEIQKDAAFELRPREKQAVQSVVEPEVEIVDLIGHLYTIDKSQYVAVPADRSWWYDDSLLHSINRALSPDGDDDLIPRSVPYFFREQSRHTGGIPLFAPPDFTTASALGYKFYNQIDSEQKALLRDLLLVCNPLCRALVALTDLEEVRVRFDAGRWTVVHEDQTDDLLEFLKKYLRRKKLEILEQPDVDTIQRTIDFLSEVGLVSIDRRHTRLYLTDKYDEQLKANKYRTRDKFEETKREIRSTQPI